MNYIKLKIFVGFLLIHLIDQICCETNNLEDKFETGREIILSISIHHENITSIFAKIDKEYDDLSNIFNDLNNKSINDFIDLSKKQIVMEVNNLAKTLNKFSIDEQSKYEDFVRTNTNTFKEKMPLFNNCLKNYNSLKKSLRCIDQHQITKNATDNELYKNLKNLLDLYNTILIPKIKDIEKRFITATNEIIFIAKNTNDELVNKKSNISLPSTSATNKKNQILMHSIPGKYIDDTLVNSYVDQKNILNTANLNNIIAIQSITLNVTLYHLSKVNNINDHDRKSLKCCFDYSKVRVDKAKIIAINDSNECVQRGSLDLKDLVFLQNKEAEIYFPPCFYNDPRPEDIFMCMGWHQSSRNAPHILKVTYEEAVNKFTKNQQSLSDKILNCSFKWRNYFDQHLNNLNDQFDICIRNQRPFKKCLEPTTHNSK